MDAKDLIFGEEARHRALAGVTKLSNAVVATLGPKGRVVIIEKGWGEPSVTKDGVSVAKEIVLADPAENIGAQMVRSVASKTSDVAGDGTTTATLLAEAIFREGMRNVTSGANAMALKRGVDQAVERVVEELKSMSQPVTQDRAALANVASVSANNDRSIGQIIADAMEKVGIEGTITVEEATGIETTLEVVEGMQFDRGYLSPYFVTDVTGMEAVLEDAYVLITEEKITHVKDLLPLLQKLAETGKQFLIIAEDVDGDALATLVLNKIRGILSCCAVKAPGFGDRRKAILDDIAVLIGGRAITKDLGRKLESIELEDLGHVKKAIIGKDETTLIEGAGETDAIQGRVSQIRKQIQDTTSDYDREKLEERLAKLAGGVAIVKVGAATEIAMKEKKDRVDDAVHATKAAVAEGIVPGGGVALLRCKGALQSLASELQGDDAIGCGIVMRALEEPLRRIAANAGVEPGVVVEHVLGGSGDYGYDAEKGTYVQLYEAGIIDPAKVVRCALQNAASIAGLLLVTEVLVTSIPEKADSKQIGGGDSDYF